MSCWIVLNIFFCRNCVHSEKKIPLPFWLLRKPLECIITVTRTDLSYRGCTGQFATVRNDLFKTQILALVRSLQPNSSAGEYFHCFREGNPFFTAFRKRASATGMMNYLYCPSIANSLRWKETQNELSSFVQNYQQTTVCQRVCILAGSTSVNNFFHVFPLCSFFWCSSWILGSDQPCPSLSLPLNSQFHVAARELSCWCLMSRIGIKTFHVLSAIFLGSNSQCWQLIYFC